MKNSSIFWAIVIVMGLVVINEIGYLGESSLALVLIAMAGSIGYLAYAQIDK